KQHQGWVEVASEVGMGTTFKIYFPAIARLVEPAGDASTLTEPVRGGKETILLVEDEPLVREFVREILLGYQYHVIEARSGMEALQLWDEHDGRVDLLLTDMVMPEGLNGRDLATQLKKRKPGLRAIFTSGYSAEILGKDFDQSEAAFLPKPYLPPQLAQLVRQSLDAPV